MTKPGLLLASDEMLNHQIVDTFGRVAQSDRSWTEKVWAMAAARDGSLSIAFGLGKYLNRNVMDAFAGVSRGTEQWTVRASRSLAPDIERHEVGPIGYEIVQALSSTRYRLDENDIVPISFDVEIEGVAPPAMEARETHHSRSRLRIDADIMRFHQAGIARGWVEVDGARTEIDDALWVGSRDRSWGVRYAVGLPPEDIETPNPTEASGMFVWMPVTMTNPDGTHHTLFVYYQHYHGEGWSTGSARGAIERPDGRSEPFSDVIPDLAFDDENRRLIGGTLQAIHRGGASHTYRIDPVSATGFHLGAGLYGGFEGHHQGEWRGSLHVDGEHLEGCDTAAVARRIHQHRDCIVRVEDLEDGSSGVGTLQSNVVGAHPDLGLTAAASFV